MFPPVSMPPNLMGLTADFALLDSALDDSDADLAADAMALADVALDRGPVLSRYGPHGRDHAGPSRADNAAHPVASGAARFAAAHVP